MLLILKCSEVAACMPVTLFHTFKSVWDLCRMILVSKCWKVAVCVHMTLFCIFKSVWDLCGVVFVSKCWKVAVCMPATLFHIFKSVLDLCRVLLVSKCWKMAVCMPVTLFRTFKSVLDLCGARFVSKCWRRSSVPLRSKRYLGAWESPYVCSLVAFVDVSSRVAFWNSSKHRHHPLIIWFLKHTEMSSFHTSYLPNLNHFLCKCLCCIPCQSLCRFFLCVCVCVCIFFFIKVICLLCVLSELRSCENRGGHPGLPIP